MLQYSKNPKYNSVTVHGALSECNLSTGCFISASLSGAAPHCSILLSNVRGSVLMNRWQLVASFHVCAMFVVCDHAPLPPCPRTSAHDLPVPTLSRHSGWSLAAAIQTGARRNLSQSAAARAMVHVTSRASRAQLNERRSSASWPNRTRTGRPVESPRTPRVRRTGYSYKGITSPPHGDPMPLLLLLIDICVVTVSRPLIVLFWSTASLSGADPARCANVHVERAQRDSCQQRSLPIFVVADCDELRSSSCVVGEQVPMEYYSISERANVRRIGIYCPGSELIKINGYYCAPSKPISSSSTHRLRRTTTVTCVYNSGY